MAEIPQKETESSDDVQPISSKRIIIVLVLLLVIVIVCTTTQRSTVDLEQIRKDRLKDGQLPPVLIQL